MRRALGSETMFHFARRPVRYSDGWSAFEISFDSLSTSNKVLMPDVMARNGRLFFSSEAYEKLYGLCEEHGEFLPVTYEGRDGFLFNILSVAESVGGLDESLSIKNEFGEVQALAFCEDKLVGMNIFRTEFDGYMGIYCSDAFKSTVEQAGLKGLTFSTDVGTTYPSDTNAQRPQRQ